MRVERQSSTEGIGGAEVRVHGADGVLRVACTQADGWATVDHVPWGVVTIEATAQSHATAVRANVPPEDWAAYGASIDLDRAGTLGGRVVEAATGRVVAGASVTAFEGGTLFMKPFPPQRLGTSYGATTTDVRGVFRLEGVAQEPQFSLRIVRVEAEGYRTVWKVAPDDGEDFNFEIRLVPGGEIRGAVLSADGEPVPHATILAALSRQDPSEEPHGIRLPPRFLHPLTWRGARASPVRAEDVWGTLLAMSDATGRFRLMGVGPGESYNIVAIAKGHAPSEMARSVRLHRDGGESRLDLRLRPPSTVAVQAVDRVGRPFPGLHVELMRRTEYRSVTLATAETDALGRASFEDCVPEDLSISAWDSGAGVGAQSTVAAGAGIREVHVAFTSLAPGPSASRRPTPLATPPRAARQRKPVADSLATILARFAVPPGVAPPASVSCGARMGYGSSAGENLEWAPDATGTVPMRWTLDWNEFTFIVEAEGFLPIVHEVRPTSDARPIDLGTFTLTPGLTLEGVVTDPEGIPLPCVHVTAVFPPRPPPPTEYDALEEKTRRFTRTAVSGPDGTFRFAGLPKGPVAITMEDARFLPYDETVEVTEDHTAARFVVDSGVRLTVRALDPDGTPMARADVWIYKGEASAAALAWGTTDSDGTFPLCLPPGTCRIEATSEPRREGDVPVQVGVTLERGTDRIVTIVVPLAEPRHRR